MKYTIEGFSQAFAMTLKKEFEVNGKTVTRKIDCTDLVILRWFVDFYPKMKKIEVDGKQYAWLTHKKLQNDLPLVDINKRSFIDRMQKLVDFDILEYKLVKEGGTFSLYTFGQNYIKLIQDDEIDGGMQSNDIGGANQSDTGTQSNDKGECNQTHNKDKSIIDRSIINKSIKNNKKNDPFEKLIDKYLYPDGKSARFNDCAERKELLLEWLNVRKAKRAAMTERAISLNLNKLDSLASKSGLSVVKYLEEIICRGWAAFYEIKKYEQNNNGKTYGANGVAIDPNAPDDLKDLF